MSAREFRTYQSALTSAYEEEVSGIAYFAALAERYSGNRHAALQLMSKIESAMARDLKALMTRHGFVITTSPELEAQGRADATTEPDWPEFMSVMAESYDDFVIEFQATQNLAPPEDHPVLQHLVDHELALIAFAKAERAGHLEPQVFLQDFLAKIA